MAEKSRVRMPEGIALDTIDLLAYYKMIPEVRLMLERYDSPDSVIVKGSPLKIRLDLLTTEDKLEVALTEQDREEPSKALEELLGIVNMLHERLASTDKAEESKKAGWRVVKNSIVRQAALAHIRAQEPIQLCDWSAVSTEGYMDTVNRLLSQVDVDMDTLEDEEQLEIVCARNQRRALEDIFVDKRRAVSSLKMRALLDENCLEAFEMQMKEFVRALDRALLPTPKLIEMYMDPSYMADVDDVGGAGVQRSASPESHSIDEASSPSRPGAKRKADASNLGTPQNVQPAAQKLLALSAANGVLQQDLAGRRPGTVAAALAVAEKLPEPSPSRRSVAVCGGSGATAPSRRTVAGVGTGSEAAAPSRRTVAVGGAGSGATVPIRRTIAGGGAGSGATVPIRRTIVGGGGGSEAAAGDNRRPRGPAAMLSSQGEQVNFDDSQSVDESQTRSALRGRRTPEPGHPVHSPPRQARGRVPWTDDEEANLRAAIEEFGKGQWALALKHYAFNECRSSVDLKDKWRNIERKEKEKG